MPELRITATYSATDGSMPESVELTWEGELPPVAEVVAIIGALDLPGRRYAEAVSTGNGPRVPTDPH